MRQRARTDELARSWDLNAEAWTTTVRQGAIESRRVATDRAILSTVLALSPRRVLDVGCGEGWLSRALVSADISVVGVDGSESLVRAAQAEDPTGLYVQLRYEEFSRLSATVGRDFDAAVFNFSLFDESIHPVLTNVAAAVRPGGAIVIQTVYEISEGWKTETFSCASTRFPAPMPWYSRSRESWLQVLAEVPLEVSSVRSIQHPGSGRSLSLLIVANRPGV